MFSRIVPQVPYQGRPAAGTQQPEKEGRLMLSRIIPQVPYQGRPAAGTHQPEEEGRLMLSRTQDMSKPMNEMLWLPK